MQKLGNQFEKRIKHIIKLGKMISKTQVCKKLKPWQKILADNRVLSSSVVSKITCNRCVVYNIAFYVQCRCFRRIIVSSTSIWLQSSEYYISEFV